MVKICFLCCIRLRDSDEKMEEFPETEKCDCQLASKQSPEITADSGKRNQKENTSDTQQQSDGIERKRKRRYILARSKC